MKKSILFITISVLTQNVHAQNVGIGTNTPASKFTINGDLALLSSQLTVSNGITYALDVNTSKFTNYKLIGPTSNFVIAGITAGSDGRIITLYNRTGNSLELYDEDMAGASPNNRIKTSTNGTLAIYPNGNVTLQYDISINRWQVQNTHYSSLDYFGGSAGTNFWTASGNNIYNNNPGNIGIGTLTPLQKLDVNGASVLANNTVIDPKNYPNRVVAGRITDGPGWDALSAIGGSANTNFLSATGRPWAIGHNGFDLFIASGLSATNALQTALQIKGTNGNVLLNPVGGNTGIKNSSPNASLSVGRGTGNDGTAAFFGSQYSSHFNFSTSEDTYIRAGKDGSNVYVNDIPNGNVNIAGGGGVTNIGGDTYIGGNANVNGGVNNGIYAGTTGGLNMVPLGIFSFDLSTTTLNEAVGVITNEIGNVATGSWTSNISIYIDDAVRFTINLNPAITNGYSKIYAIGNAGYRHGDGNTNDGNYVSGASLTNTNTIVELYYKMDALFPHRFHGIGRVMIYGVK